MREIENQIIKVENQLLDFNLNIKNRRYRNLSPDFWVTNLELPFKFYDTLSKIPMLRIFPSNINLWINNVRILFGNKSLTQNGYRNLVGHLFLWPFTKSYIFSIQADAFFLKRKSKYVVLFYIDKINPSIIKVNLSEDNTKRFKKQLSNEIESQLIASEIKHAHVSIPKIKSYEIESGTLFLEQEYLTHCKEIKHFPSKIKSDIYDKVFDFMFDFYKKTGIEARKLDNDYFIGLINSILEISSRNEKLTKIIFRFQNLLLKEKLLFWSRIHKDLNSQNILYDKLKSIYIIDWGLSKEFYWADELNKNSEFSYDSANKIFNNILAYLKLNSCDVYNVEEQRFLVCCINFLEDFNTQRQINMIPDFIAKLNYLGLK